MVGSRSLRAFEEFLDLFLFSTFSFCANLSTLIQEEASKINIEYTYWA